MTCTTFSTSGQTKMFNGFDTGDFIISREYVKQEIKSYYSSTSQNQKLMCL